MEQADAVALISKGIETSEPQHWADLGCGGGTFTAALLHLLPIGSQIEAVDRQQQHLDIPVNFTIADFETDNLAFSQLDGILMANALHYIKEKTKLIHKLETYCIKHPSFLIVEYDTDSANPWVPYPLSYLNLKHLFTGIGYKKITKLAERPSVYNRDNIYAALIQR